MNTIEVAKSVELEGKAYYEKCAAESPARELSGIFSLLAAEEQRHYELFDAWQKEKRVPAVLDPGTVSAEAKRIFAGISTRIGFSPTGYDYARAYGFALEMERKSIALYESMLSASDSPDEKKALSFLITEEQKHEHLVEHLLEFVNVPKTFLENAEFNHFADD